MCPFHCRNYTDIGKINSQRKQITLIQSSHHEFVQAKMNSLFKMLFLMANGQLITFGSVKLSILQYQIFGIVMVPAQPYSVIKVCNMISFSFSL